MSVLSKILKMEVACLFVSSPFSEFSGSWPMYTEFLLCIGGLFQNVLSCLCLLTVCGVLLILFYFSTTELYHLLLMPAVQE